MRVFPHTNQNLRALRVLVVEDELLIRWSITEMLAHAGHTVMEAADGASAHKPFEMHDLKSLLEEACRPGDV